MPELFKMDRQRQSSTSTSAKSVWHEIHRLELKLRHRTSPLIIAPPHADALSRFAVEDGAGERLLVNGRAQRGGGTHSESCRYREENEGGHRKNRPLNL